MSADRSTFDPGAEAVEGVGPYVDVGGNRWATWAAYEKLCEALDIAVHHADNLRRYIDRQPVRGLDESGCALETIRPLVEKVRLER